MTKMKVKFGKKVVNLKSKECGTILDCIDSEYQTMTSVSERTQSAEVEKKANVVIETFERIFNVKLSDQERLLEGFEVTLDHDAYQVYRLTQNKVFNTALIQHFVNVGGIIGKASELEALKIASEKMDDDHVSDQFVLMREIFCRLIAISLSHETLESATPGDKGGKILDVLRKLSSDFNVKEVSLYSPTLGKSKTTTFTKLLQDIHLIVEPIKRVIEAVEIMNLNNTALTHALNYLHMSKNSIKAQLIGLMAYKYNLDISTAQLRPDCLDSTFERVFEDYRQKVRLKKRSSRDKLIDSDNRSGSPQHEVSDVIDELMLLLGKTDELIKLFDEVTTAAKFGGWTFWLLQVIDNDKLVKVIDTYDTEQNALCDKIKFGDFFKSTQGKAITSNDAWSSSSKTKNSLTATKRDFKRMQDDEVLTILYEKNRRNIENLSRIHATSKIKFINVENLRKINGAEGVVAQLTGDTRDGHRIVHIADADQVSAFSNQCIQRAQEVHGPEVGCTIYTSDGTDVSSTLFGGLNLHLKKALTKRIGINVKACEFKYFREALLSAVTKDLFKSRDGKSIEVITDNFNEDTVKGYVDSAVATLCQFRENQRTYYHEQTRAPRLKTFVSKCDDEEAQEFAYATPEDGSANVLGYLPVEVPPGTPYKHVLDAIASGHDAEKQKKVIDILAQEMFTALQTDINTSLFLDLRWKPGGFPELFEMMERGDIVTAKNFCERPYVVRAYVQKELEKTGRLTTGLIKAWAIVNNINLVIHRKGLKETDPYSQERVDTRPDNSDTYDILEITPFSFVAVQPSEQARLNLVTAMSSGEDGLESLPNRRHDRVLTTRSRSLPTTPGNSPEKPGDDSLQRSQSARRGRGSTCSPSPFKSSLFSPSPPAQGSRRVTRTNSSFGDALSSSIDPELLASIALLNANLKQKSDSEPNKPNHLKSQTSEGAAVMTGSKGF